MEYKHYILIAIVLLAITSMIIIYKKMKEGFGQTNLKIYGITIIVFAALLLAVSDVPAEKTAACYGILGAIGGYLFGIKENN